LIFVPWGCIPYAPYAPWISGLEHHECPLLSHVFPAPLVLKDFVGYAPCRNGMLLVLGDTFGCFSLDPVRYIRVSYDLRFGISFRSVANIGDISPSDN